MKINSKTDYNRHRVNSGNGPHKILEMLQEEAMKKKSVNVLTKKEAHIEA